MNDFEIIEDLSDYNNWTKSYRYKTYHARKDSKEYLVKYPQDETHKRMIRNEVRFREFFNRLETKNVICTPIYEVTEDYIAFDWVEASNLSEPAGPYGEFEKQIDRYARLLVEMDRAAEGFMPSTDDTEAISAHSKRQLSRNELTADLVEAIKAGYLDEDDINIYIKEYKQVADELEKRYQHGDFAPWHVFVRGDEWLIYDCEHANSTKHRFLDVAHTYARLATICRRSDLARRFLNEFIANHDSFSTPEAKQFTRIMISQAFGELINSFNDRNSNDFKDEARKLFSVAKTQDISKLR